MTNMLAIRGWRGWGLSAASLGVLVAGGLYVALAQRPEVPSPPAEQVTPPLDASERPHSGASTGEVCCFGPCDRTVRKQRSKDEPRERLDKLDIADGMSSVERAVTECYTRYKIPGMAMVRFVIERDGTVVEPPVTVGVFAGTATGACVASAVQRATFLPYTHGPRMGFSYPFIFR